MYPIIDRPDWDNLVHYHNSGLWDVEQKRGMPSKRVICAHYERDLITAQHQIAPYRTTDNRHRKK